MAMLLARVRIAAELGARVVNTQGANPASSADEDTFVTRIEAVAEEAQRVGVILALEVADGLTASATSIRALMPRLGGAPIQINYDTGNLPFYSGLDPVAEYEPIHQYVAHVHMKDHIGGVDDYDFPALGEGSLDLAGFVALAMRLGYRGPLSAEIEFQHPTDRPAIEEINAAARASFDAMQRYVASA
jgi:inosose dehydratase